jgi:hypothetical protein
MKGPIRVLSATIALLAIGGNTAVHAQGRGRGRGEVQNRQPTPVPAAEQQRRIEEERERAAAYQKHVDQQLRVVQQKTAVLDRQRRAAQFRAQQQYATQLQEQQRRLQAERDYSNDPYISAPPAYRYVIAGSSRQTNEYGAQVLRQAVNTGYQQGQLAGQADRQDGWRSSYQGSPAYQDANFGYTGNYVAQSDYNYYFRQGFRRGYQDGYAASVQYGTTANGTTSILTNVLTAILGLVPIR